MTAVARAVRGGHCPWSAPCAHDDLLRLSVAVRVQRDVELHRVAFHVPVFAVSWLCPSGG
eukprot:5275322-Pyramimonas_sp.AAC.1